MSKLYTYSYPYLSLWQTAAAGVKRRHASPQKLAIQAGQTPAAPPPEVDLEAPVHIIGVPLAAGQPDTVQAMFAPKQGATLDLAAAADAVLHTAEDCAKAAAEFLWAEITGNKDRSDTLAGELKSPNATPPGLNA